MIGLKSGAANTFSYNVDRRRRVYDSANVNDPLLEKSGTLCCANEKPRGGWLAATKIT